MADKLIPISVTPSDGDSGVSTDIEISINYDCEIEPGCLTPSNFFIILKSPTLTSEYIKEISTLIPSTLIEVRTPDVEDYGDFVLGTAGALYKSTIKIKPNNLLPSNTEFSIILGNSIVERNVFAPIRNSLNTGTGDIFVEGPNLGTSNDTYIVTINVGGDKTDAHYSWRRSSDNKIGPLTKASSSYYEMTDGIRIRFGDGTFIPGDIFTFNVKEIAQFSEIQTWNFTTALTSYPTPPGEDSDDLIGTPGDDSSNIFVTEEEFKVVSINPPYAATNLPVPSVGSVTLNQILYSTKEKTNVFNGTLIQYREATSGLSITSSPYEITIDVFNGTTTLKEVVDLFNLTSASGMDLVKSMVASVPLEYETEVVNIAYKGRIADGALPLKITIEFNMDLKDEGIRDKIKITNRNIVTNAKNEEFYSHQINGKKLILTILE